MSTRRLVLASAAAALACRIGGADPALGPGRQRHQRQRRHHQCADGSTTCSGVIARRQHSPRIHAVPAVDVERDALRPEHFTAHAAVEQGCLIRRRSDHARRAGLQAAVVHIGVEREHAVVARRLRQRKRFGECLGRWCQQSDQRTSGHTNTGQGLSATLYGEHDVDVTPNSAETL